MYAVARFVSTVWMPRAARARSGRQERRGSRAGYAKMETKGGFATTIDEELAAFIAEQRAFYLATASADGQPYIQHRGGPKGVLRVLDDRTLGFADFAGNRQYISRPAILPTTPKR